MPGLLEKLNISTNAVINGNKVYWRKYTYGEMFSFEYNNPKTKDILEYYDRRPLIYCLGVNKYKNIIGINFNFIFPDNTRYKILNRLYTLTLKKPRLLLHNLTPSRFTKLGFSRDEAIRMSIAMRTYKPYRMKNRNDINSDVWIESIKKHKPRYTEYSRGNIMKLLERKFVEVKHG